MQVDDGLLDDYLTEWTVARTQMTDRVDCRLEFIEDGFRGYLTPLTLTEGQRDHWRQKMRLHHTDVSEISFAEPQDFYHEIIIETTSVLQARQTLSELAEELDVLAYTLRRNEPRAPAPP